PTRGGACGLLSEWWRGTESNCRHYDFQSYALPTELPRHEAADVRLGRAIAARSVAAGDELVTSSATRQVDDDNVSAERRARSCRLARRPGLKTIARRSRRTTTVSAATANRRLRARTRRSMGKEVHAPC